MKTITFVGLYQEYNMGDPVIAHCTEWLFTRNRDGLDVRHVTLDHVDHELRYSFSNRLKRKIRKIVGREMTNGELADKVYAQSVVYFSNEIKGSDWIVVVGGGLVKYKYQMLGVELAALCVAADKEGIPVFINSVGIEGYDENDKICKWIKAAFELPVVKSVTSRDDVSTLKNCYLQGAGHVECEKVADPAVWTSEAFSIKKKESHKVGLGIGRAGLFRANGIDLDGQQLQTLYASIARELIRRDYEVELFTNGLLSDCAMAKRVQNVLRRQGTEIALSFPGSAAELVDIISSYAVVVATRLHSTIISYALDIPAIGLVWNEKLSFFGENIGAPENFIMPDAFDPVHIVDCMEEAAKRNYNQQWKEVFKATIMDNVERLRNKYHIGE